MTPIKKIFFMISYVILLLLFGLFLIIIQSSLVIQRNEVTKNLGNIHFMYSRSFATLWMTNTK